LKILILLMLLAILGSLAAGIVHIVSDRGHSKRAVKALTLRISLSLLLFALLFVGYLSGYLKPHGLLPPQAAPEAQPRTPQNQ
jgi:hypothetical protein